MIYRFDCYHKSSLHRLRRVYSIEADSLDEAIEALAVESPDAKPFACAGESRTHTGRFYNLDKLLGGA